MNERRFRRRVAVLVLVAVAATGAVASGASGKRDRRCDVAGFALPDGGQTFAETLPDDTYNVGWVAEGTTTFTCGNRILGVDVWEHAYYVKVDPKEGDDTVIVKGRISYRLTGDFDGDGSDDVVNLDGRISGDGVDQGDAVTLTFTGRGSSADGSRIKLRHRGTLDLRGEEWRDLEVRSGLFNPTNVSFLP
jgi:hypothetical protein